MSRTSVISVIILIITLAPLLFACDDSEPEDDALHSVLLKQDGDEVVFVSEEGEPLWSAPPGELATDIVDSRKLEQNQGVCIHCFVCFISPQQIDCYGCSFVACEP